MLDEWHDSNRACSKLLRSRWNGGTGKSTIACALAAAWAADVIVIPCRPSVADLAAINPSIDLARIAGKALLVAFTQATVGSSLIAEAREAREAIAAYGVPCAPVVVHHRLEHV